MIGDAVHLPHIAPCAIYSDAESPACLAAPMAEVRDRWQAHMPPLLPRLPADAQAQWASIHATVTTTTYGRWLVHPDDGADRISSMPARKAGKLDAELTAFARIASPARKKSAA
ncbi:hypothetical protein C5O80_37025 [Burkholderia sp. SRS-46]|nr:hypothetical protein C5O80_37025 [Burkholderia sp. SRS-46]